MSEKAKISDFPKDIQKLISRLPIISTPRVVELDDATAGISIDIDLLFIDDLEKIVQLKKYRPHISNRNNKLMLLFTLGL